MTPETDLPVWARSDAFPPAGPGWGWVDRKGRRFPCGSFDELAAAIAADAGARVDLVWTPAAPGLVLPEEIHELHSAMREARVRWANWEIEEGKRQMMMFGAAAGLMIVFAGGDFRRILTNGAVGLALLLFFLLGLMPWYQGTKRLRKARNWAAGEMVAGAPDLRFEVWLSIQKAPVTRILFWLLAVAGLVQLGVELQAYSERQAMGGVSFLGGLMKIVSKFGTIEGFGITIPRAGLTKHAGHVTEGEGWRLLTAPFLHGHWLHWLMNASALAYLGKRVETFARWPHLVMAFLISAWIGGEVSARFSTTASIGASGGLMGLLGFLLVFETLHRSLVPQSSRLRLLAGVVLTGVIGFVFRHFIDNAAHIGGLLAGMVYAALIFPRSSSPHRPRTTSVEVIAGGAALGLLVCSAVLACVKMI
ncbi:rhomboid family intramembrane serine protease [Luteolibacter marinus]|uniref:rhomboid family intramembrane serine protease n=1 Tax=Luteolibacter marinus TaxID=2776705 RepID=UPI0018692A85|nr:rhomboid family intramembrane serine protease [Luteolibacter marinus]